jgi:hypothetical protein
MFVDLGNFSPQRFDSFSDAIMHAGFVPNRIV